MKEFLSVTGYTRHCANIPILKALKMIIFRCKNCDIFLLFFAQNIDRGYKLKCLRAKIKEIMFTPVKSSLTL